MRSQGSRVTGQPEHLNSGPTISQDVLNRKHEWLTKGTKICSEENDYFNEIWIGKKNYPDLAEMFLLERFNIGIISFFLENERKLLIDQVVKDWTKLAHPFHNF